MVRSPCCEKAHTNKGSWTKQEDQLLINYIRVHGQGSWRSLPKAAGLLRCGKSCRLRWMNYLRPDLKRGNFTEEEDELIIKLHSLHGNKWSLIAARMPGRTDNEIKNHWNTQIKRKLISRGIDPQTHRPHNAGAAISYNSSTTTEVKNNISMDLSKCSSGTTSEESQSHKEKHINNDEMASLDLSIGLSLCPIIKTDNSTKPDLLSAAAVAMSPLTIAVATGEAYSVTQAVCLCWQLGSQSGGLCYKCHTTKCLLNTIH